MSAPVVRTFDELTISTVDWPFILMEFPEKRVPDAALQECLLYFEQLLKGALEVRGHTYTVTDISRMNQIAPASQRKIASDWMAHTILLQKAVSLGGANVTPSTILRGLITAIFWLVPPALPSIFVATRREAYAAGVKAFDAAGVALPPELRARLAKR